MYLYVRHALGWDGCLVSLMTLTLTGAASLEETVAAILVALARAELHRSAMTMTAAIAAAVVVSVTAAAMIEPAIETCLVRRAATLILMVIVVLLLAMVMMVVALALVIVAAVALMVTATAAATAILVVVVVAVVVVVLVTVLLLALVRVVVTAPIIILAVLLGGSGGVTTDITRDQGVLGRGIGHTEEAVGSIAELEAEHVLGQEYQTGTARQRRGGGIQQMEELRHVGHLHNATDAEHGAIHGTTIGHSDALEVRTEGLAGIAILDADADELVVHAVGRATHGKHLEDSGRGSELGGE